MSPDAFVVIITARAGSKRLLSKNTRLLAHMPLIEHTLRFCRDYIPETRVIVTSDDETVATICKGYDIDFHQRSPELSSDTASTLDVLRNVCEWGRVTSPVILLQPTSPIRSIETLRRAISLYEQHDESVVTVERLVNPRMGLIEDNVYHPANYELGQRSQDIPSRYRENGNLYILSNEAVRKGNLCKNRLIACTIDGEETLDIDTRDDLTRCEIALRARTPNFPPRITLSDGRSVGRGERCFIIAEACDNHIGNMDYAHKMIDVAFLAGADAVKFPAPFA